MEVDKNKILVVIAGPTAVGKTAVGIALAKHFNTEIISADSRQFFKEMTIGTAKPDQEEMQGITHHFINSHSIDEEFNAGQFEADVLILLQVLFKKCNMVFLVGGSGMYIKAVTDGLDELPKGDTALRKYFQDIKNEKGIDELRRLLKEGDPVYYEEVDLSNPQRIIRALEVIHVSGKPFSAWRKKEIKERPFRIVKIGITEDRKILYEKINRRMDSMLERGLKEEAEKLYSKRQINALQTVGYKEIFGFIDGLYTWDQTVELLKQNSRRYAKRQLTWFRQDPAYTWFEPTEISRMINFLEKEGSSM